MATALLLLVSEIRHRPFEEAEYDCPRGVPETYELSPGVHSGEETAQLTKDASTSLCLHHHTEQCLNLRYEYTGASPH
jgi:hypothetical protein